MSQVRNANVSKGVLVTQPLHAQDSATLPIAQNLYVCELFLNRVGLCDWLDSKAQCLQ